MTRLMHCLAVLAALTLTGLHSRAQENVRPVKLMVLSPQPSSAERQFFGRIVARRTVDLAFQVGGQIVELPVTEGSTVAEGGLIARLDLEPFELRLEQARLQQQQADRNLQRKETLGTRTVAPVVIEDAGTEAGLAAIAVRNAEYQLSQATLVAPFDALVASRSAAKFTTVAAGTPVVRLHDMSELRVEIEVPEILFRQARDRADIELFATVVGSDVRYPLQIREFKAETSAVGQSYTLTLAMQAPDTRNLLPGASVTVTARRKQASADLVVPAAAVVIDPDRSTHLLVFEPSGAAEGTVRKAEVTLKANAEGALVMIEGPEPGSEIVAAGAARIADGETVRRFTGFTQ